MNMPKKHRKPLKSWLNRSNLVASLGISGAAFDKWNVEPVARIGREAFFTAGDVLKNRLDRQAEVLGRSDETETSATAEQQAEKTILIREQRIAQQLKNDIAKRELAPVSLIGWTLSKVGSQIGAILDSIPLKVKNVAPHLTAAQIDAIRREIVKCQNAAANVEVDIDEYYGTNPGVSSSSDVSNAGGEAT